MKKKIKFSPVKEGQYTVEINLNDLMDDCHRCGFEKQLSEIYQYENEYAFVSSLKKGVLKYKSETLLPVKNNKNKQKILFVFGNPANHSITQGMFFFSRQNGSRHGIWNKLAIANVIQKIEINKSIPVDARKEEASTRKMAFLNGDTSSDYLVGLTTFYSFPTSADGGVKKVEKLFDPIIDEIHKQEVNRILAYEFTKEAKLVFVQKSSYAAFRATPKNKEQKTLFWPIRGKGSSGENLKMLLQGKV